MSGRSWWWQIGSRAEKALVGETGMTGEKEVMGGSLKGGVRARGQC